MVSLDLVWELCELVVFQVQSGQVLVSLALIDSCTIRTRSKMLFPDVRDGRDVYEDAGASASDAIHCSQDWADDYSMGH